MNKELADKVNKLRREIDALGDGRLRREVDVHLTRAYLLLRDGNLARLNGAEAAPAKESEWWANGQVPGKAYGDDW